MPAAAVIPAPVAYIKIVAFEKLVVGIRVSKTCPSTFGATAPSQARFWRVRFGRPFALPALFAGACAVGPRSSARVAAATRHPVQRSSSPASRRRVASGFTPAPSTARVGQACCARGSHEAGALLGVVAVRVLAVVARPPPGRFGPHGSSEGALRRVSEAAGTFTVKKLECSERAPPACIRKAWNDGKWPRPRVIRRSPFTTRQ